MGTQVGLLSSHPATPPPSPANGNPGRPSLVTSCNSSSISCKWEPRSAFSRHILQLLLHLLQMGTQVGLLSSHPATPPPSPANGNPGRPSLVTSCNSSPISCKWEPRSAFS